MHAYFGFTYPVLTVDSIKLAVGPLDSAVAEDASRSNGGGPTLQVLENLFIMNVCVCVCE
jgi:hypothetical protein